MRLLLLPGLHGTGRLFRWLLDELDGRVAHEIFVYPTDCGQSHAELAQQVLVAAGATYGAAGRSRARRPGDRAIHAACG